MLNQGESEVINGAQRQIIKRKILYTNVTYINFGFSVYLYCYFLHLIISCTAFNQSLFCHFFNMLKCKFSISDHI